MRIGSTRRAGRTRGAAALVVLCALVLPAAASAQWADEPPPPTSAPPPATTPAPPATEPPAGSPQCYPACREGYVCGPQGQCVSACNPPCAAGTVCGAGGRCVPQAGAVPAPAGPTPPYGRPAQPYGQPDATPPEPVSDGWATGAAIWGFINIPLLLGGAGAIVATDGEGGRAIGGALTLYNAISTPILGAGAASPRGVRSSTGLLVPAWILYSLSIASAVALLGVSVADDDVDPTYAFIPAGFGALSNLLFAIAGLTEGARARRAMREQSSATEPTWGVAPAVWNRGGARPAGGVSLGGGF